MSADHYRVIYEQYWQHARHNENQRLSFTQLYSVLVGVVLAFLTSRSELNLSLEISLYVFLLILTILGYFIVYSLNIPSVIFSRLTEQIAVCQWNVPQQYLRWFTESPQRKTKRLHVAEIFIIFYSLMASLFTVMLCNRILDMLLIDYKIRIFVLMPLFICTIITLVFLYRHFMKGEVEQVIRNIQKEIEKCRGNTCD